MKNKGRTIITEKGKEETSNFLTKPKNKKQETTKKDNQADKSSSLELPYVTPLENKQRKSFTSKALHPLTSIPKTRTLQKQKSAGKPEDGRPSPPVKLLSNGAVAEPGHSSSSEGEKEFASPEWDLPLLKISSQSDSLQQISMQTMNADPFLKRSFSARTCTPPPPSPNLLSRGTYSSVLNANSEGNLKKALGNKLSAAASLPGKNGNPTFAAVAGGYDKSPGGTGSGKTENQAKTLPHMMSVESDSSDSSGLWSPVDTATSPNFMSANSFSAFGPNNSFNLTGVFSGINFPKTSEPQQSWPEFTAAPSSIWDAPNSDSLHSWPSSSCSPTVPTTSILGNGHNPWSTTSPFSSSIWSTSGEPALHSFPPSSSSTTLNDLVSSAPPPTPSPTDISRTYNPWSVWRPTLGRQGSEPWPNPPGDSS